MTPPTYPYISAEQMIDKYRDEIQKLQAQCDEFKLEVRTLVDENNSLQRECDELRVDIHELKRQLRIEDAD